MGTGSGAIRNDARIGAPVELVSPLSGFRLGGFGGFDALREPEVMTAEEVCKTLRISAQTLRRMEKAGKIKRSGVSSRRLFWWGEVRRVAATPLGEAA